MVMNEKVVRVFANVLWTYLMVTLGSIVMYCDLKFEPFRTSGGDVLYLAIAVATVPVLVGLHDNKN